MAFVSGKETTARIPESLTCLEGSRSGEIAAPRRKNNLLKDPVLNAFVKSRLFPSVLQWLNLLVLSALIYFAWGATEEALRYTNIGSWVVWIVWWPVVIGAALFAGRLWCTVCHLRLISRWFSSFGLKRRPPQWLTKNGASVTLLMLLGLIVLHSSVVSYDVHHIPHYTALYLCILIAYAAAVSFVYQRGTFCKLFCPLVAFFGPYSQLSPTELRSGNLGTCLKCGRNGHRKMCLHSCSNDMMMQMRVSNENCLLCFQCVKACPNDNVQFGFRGFFTDLRRNAGRSWTSVLAGVLILGIILQELGEEWEVFESIVLGLPNWIEGLGVPATLISGYMWLETVCLNIATPLLLVTAAGAAACLVGRCGTALTHVKLYGAALLPLVFSVHLAKLVKKLNEKLGYAPHVFSDPQGYDTAEAISAGALLPPAPFFVPNAVMGWILMALVAAGICASLYSLERIARDAYPDKVGTGILTSLPFAALFLSCGAGFELVIYHWLIG